MSSWWKHFSSASAELDLEPLNSCHNDMLIIVLPKEVQPKPEFALESDEEFHQFETALLQSTHIEGTFQGRFDYLKSRWNRMRLVLQRISDLAVNPTAHLDR